MRSAVIPSGRIYPHIVAIDITAIRIVAVIGFPESTAVCFNDLVPLYRAVLIIPGTIVIQNDYLTGTDGYFFTGKAGRCKACYQQD
jgi:hypothetical protein